MKYEIEDNVPIPYKKKGRPKYENLELEKMEVGQSFFASDLSRTYIAAHAQAYARIKPGVKFSIHKATKDGVHGFRVWRRE